MDTLDEQIKEWTESEISKSCLALAEKGKKGEKIGALVWMDCSSFSRSDKERIPNVFQAVKETAPEATATAKLRITIVFNHIHNPGKWLVNCPELGINEKVLNSMFAHEAAAEAEEFCREKAMFIVGFFIPQSVLHGIEVIKSLLSKKQQSQPDDDLKEETPEKPQDNSHGDLVPLVWEIEKLRGKEGGCTMNELIAEVKKSFKGLENIKQLP